MLLRQKSSSELLKGLQATYSSMACDVLFLITYCKQLKRLNKLLDGLYVFKIVNKIRYATNNIEKDL